MFTLSKLAGQTEFGNLNATLTCKRYQGRTVAPPITPDLPDYRLGLFFLFKATGLSYTGHLHVRTVEKNAVSKVNNLLLTFSCSHAVYLKLTPDMLVLSFMF